MNIIRGVRSYLVTIGPFLAEADTLADACDLLIAHGCAPRHAAHLARLAAADRALSAAPPLNLPAGRSIPAAAVGSPQECR